MPREVEYTLLFIEASGRWHKPAKSALLLSYWIVICKPDDSQTNQSDKHHIKRTLRQLCD